jgi:hypothetical protein
MSIDIKSTLPWQDNDSGLIYGQCQGDDDEAPFIADVCDSPLAYTPAEKAKAELITRACNTHYIMLDALTLAQRALNTAPRFHVGDTNSYAIASKIDQAITEAKGRR